jgi:hypothetical protein
VLTAATLAVVPPASQGVPDSVGNALDLGGTGTDTGVIQETVKEVNQKSGATDDTPPNQEVTETTVTAIDGQLINSTVSEVTGGTTRRSLQKRAPDFHQIFAGTGVAGGPERDAAIEGTAYLTYTVVPNSTYNVDACLDFCRRVDKCGRPFPFFTWFDYLSC